MKSLTETNTYINLKNVEEGEKEHMNFGCSEETSLCSSAQESTLSMRTTNIQKPDGMEYETDMNDQNILNKKNEKLFKPCKNGNCYCFASDSDDFRKAKNLNRSKQNKPRKSVSEVNRYHPTSSRESDIESCTSFDVTEDIQSRKNIPFTSKQNNKLRIDKCEYLPNLNANSKTFIRGKPKNGFPIIHIIQEFHENTVVSEVRINRPQKQVQQVKRDSSKNPTDTKKNIELDKNGLIHKFEKLKHSTSVNSFGVADTCKEKYFVNKNRKKLRYVGGQLYQKRIGCESIKHYKEYKSPPKKPPRSVSSSSEKSKAKHKVDNQNERRNRQDFDDDCSKINILELNNRKSFPFDNKSQYHKTPVNCSLSEDEKSVSKTKSFGWICPDTEIVEMLESNRKMKQLQQKPEAQIGWQMPPKLDIDTVDGISESLPNDSHNFAKNMESKSTPVKSDFSNQTDYSVKDQFKEFISNSIKHSKKKSQNCNKVESNSSFRQKAKIGAKVFFINSKQKLVEMVTGRSDKEILNPTPKINVAVQTTADYLSENIDDTFLGNNTLDRINGIGSRYSLQSPHDRYLAYTSKENTTNDFDFNRTVNSPRSQRSIQRKLSFSPKKLINFNYRPSCIEPPNSDNYYYKSFDNHINKDFTLSSINDILLNIRAKLETSDNHAENTFQEVSQREKCIKKSFEVKEEVKKNDDLENSKRVSAQAEVHNNPNLIYSECGEDKLVVTGSVSNHSLNDIPHYYIDKNPNAIYARVRKVVKSCNNINDKNSPSIAPNKSHILKSEICLNNSIYPTSNISNENEAEQSQFTKNYTAADIIMDSSVLFSDEKEVEYESLNDFSCSNYHMIPQLESKETFMGNDVVDGFSYSHIEVNLKLESDLKEIDKNGQKSNKSSPAVYKNIKQKFRESFYKSKTYLKKEASIFSSLNKLKNIKKLNNESRDKNNSAIWDESDLGIYDLYSETPSVSEQLQKTVSLCRKIPYLDSTIEAVEAERLLLYSTLKTEKVKYTDNLTTKSNSSVNVGKINIESFKLTVSTDINRDIFFNYFYIAVFSYGSKIKSSNFAEKLENTVIFRNCNIIFDSVNPNSKIKCDIYMLQLRKILNMRKNQDELFLKMENLDVPYESSGDEFLSRFKLQGYFEFNSRNFIPYMIKENYKNREYDLMICLKTENTITIPLVLVARSTHLKNEVSIQAAFEILFPKFEMEGFICVQDLKNKHNWNRLWCKLDYFVLRMWNYPQDYLEKDNIYSFDLCKCLTFPVKVADRSSCARLRSFFLTVLCETDDNCYQDVYFSTDNQDHLNFWIDGLNRILEFVNSWMKLNTENIIQLNNDC